MRSRPGPSFLLFAAVMALVAVVGVPGTPGPPDVPARPAGGSCTVLRVVDGDTVEMACPAAGRFRARLTGYDTPESFAPRCPAEARAARRATERLRGLVAASRGLEARLGGWDRYDRRLVRLRLDGRDVGATLIAEGLAVPYRGGARPDWCARLG
jgi:endonuclease YncB( thermonuclease family)